MRRLRTACPPVFSGSFASTVLRALFGVAFRKAVVAFRRTFFRAAGFCTAVFCAVVFRAVFPRAVFRRVVVLRVAGFLRGFTPATGSGNVCGTGASSCAVSTAASALTSMPLPVLVLSCFWLSAVPAAGPDQNPAPTAQASRKRKNGKQKGAQRPLATAPHRKKRNPDALRRKTVNSTAPTAGQALFSYRAYFFLERKNDTKRKRIIEVSEIW